MYTYVSNSFIHSFIYLTRAAWPIEPQEHNTHTHSTHIHTHKRKELNTATQLKSQTTMSTELK